VVASLTELGADPRQRQTHQVDQDEYDDDIHVESLKETGRLAPGVCGVEHHLRVVADLEHDAHHFFGCF